MQSFDNFEIYDSGWYPICNSGFLRLAFFLSSGLFLVQPMAPRHSARNPLHQRHERLHQRHERPPFPSHIHGFLPTLHPVHALSMLCFARERQRTRLLDDCLHTLSNTISTLLIF
jgi:hypothetical protein